MCFRSIFRHEKKVLALVLAFACAFTMFAGAAFTDQADINADNVDAVDLLTTLKIIKGYEDGSFDPDGVVTRAEMAKMIYTIRNDGNDDASAHVGNTTSFTDISGHWAEGYIKYLQNTGIVAGKSATKFDPDSQVTTVEAMKMALALTGYDEKNAGLTGIDWEKNTLSYATTIGLTDDVASAMRSGCARQDAAQILANCLGATAVRYSAVVENFVNDSKSGLSFAGDPISVGNKWMDLYTNIGTLVGIDGDKLTITMTQSDEADSDDKDIKNFIDLDTDYSDLLGQKVKVLFRDGKNNEVIGVYATVDNTVYTVEANDTSKDDDKVSFGGESYRLDDEGRIRTYIDGSSTPIWTSLDELDHNALNPNMYTFVDTDDNGRLDTLVVRTYEVAKASYVASDRIIAHGYTYETDDNTVADDIAQDDWVVITKDLYNDNYSIVKADVQTATLDAMRDNRNKGIHYDDQALVNGVDYSEYQIGDNWYNGSDDADAKVVQSNRSENDLHAVRAGESVDYVAVNGIMFYVQRSSGDFNGKVDNVALILSLANNGVEDLARIQLFNGDTLTVEVADRTGDVPFGQLQEGVLYEYSVSGDKYYFEKGLNNGITDNGGDDRWEEYYGDLTYRGTLTEDGTNTDGHYNADVASMDEINRVKIDDNAEIMLFSMQATGSAKAATMTGKQFKALNLADIIPEKDGDYAASEKLAEKTDIAAHAATAPKGDDQIYAYAFSGKLGGLNRIGALALQVTDGAVLDALTYDSWNNYGYILTDAKFVANSNKTMTYTIWTGTEAIEVQEDYNEWKNRQKGQLIGFNDLERGDVNVIDDVDKLDYDDIFFDAVTDVSNDEETVIFENGGEKDISDATIMFVDSDKGEGFTADEVSGIKNAIKDNNGDYLANAIYYTSGNDVLLVVFDTVDWMHNGIYEGKLPQGDVIYGEDAVTGNEKAITYTGLPTLTVGEETDAEIVLATKNIDNGSVVDADIDRNGTLAVASTTNVDRNGNATITLSGTPATAGTVDLDVEVDGKTATFPITVDAAPSNIAIAVDVADDVSLEYGDTSGSFTVDVTALNAYNNKPVIDSIMLEGTTTDVKNNFNVSGIKNIMSNTPANPQTWTVEFADGKEEANNVGTYVVKFSIGDNDTGSFEFDITKATANTLGINWANLSDLGVGGFAASMTATDFNTLKDGLVVETAEGVVGELSYAEKSTTSGTNKNVVESTDVWTVTLTVTADGNHVLASAPTDGTSMSAWTDDTDTSAWVYTYDVTIS